jgi:hypothetical protein
MKAKDAASNQQNSEKRKAHVATFAKVLDGRKQPIRGLWIRGTRYYARLNVENPLTGIKKNQRVPLITKDGDPVQTVAQAMEVTALMWITLVKRLSQKFFNCSARLGLMA